MKERLSRQAGRGPRQDAGGSRRRSRGPGLLHLQGQPHQLPLPAPRDHARRHPQKTGRQRSRSGSYALGMRTGRHVRGGGPLPDAGGERPPGCPIPAHVFRALRESAPRCPPLAGTVVGHGRRHDAMPSVSAQAPDTVLSLTRHRHDGPRSQKAGMLGMACPRRAPGMRPARKARGRQRRRDRPEPFPCPLPSCRCGLWRG